MMVRNEQEILILKEGGRRLAHIIHAVGERAQPGISVKELDAHAETLIRQGGDVPAFLHYVPRGARRPYPATLCVSVNDVVVHGIPTESDYVLREGDIVSLDTGIVHEGLITDTCITVGVGHIDAPAKHLIATTKKALTAGVEAARAGNHMGDIGHAIQHVVADTGFTILDELIGHGVGRAVHELPNVFHTGCPKEGELLVPGMVFTIEPALTEGKNAIYLATDGYAYKTKDHARTAQFEHTIIITDDGNDVLA